MVTFPVTDCVKKLMATAAKIGLWGYTSEDNTFEPLSQEILTNGGLTNEPAESSTTQCYIYQPGDICTVIDDYEGFNLLWLRQIQPNEISLRLTRNGKIQVSYQGQPVIRMRGIDLIRTENGCYSLDYWLNAA
jgi:hypothetical protein